MTPQGSTTSQFVAALAQQLVDRFASHPTLSSVRVYEVPPPDDIKLTDTVVLIRDTVDESLEWGHPSYMRDVYGTVPGQVVAAATDPDLDVAWRTAMDRAALILDEVIFELTDNTPVVGQQTFYARVAGLHPRPYVAADGGWVCRTTYEIEYHARVG